MTSDSFSSNDIFFQSLDPNSSREGGSEGDENENYVEDEELENEEDLEFLKNTYFRVGHEGCDEYTELTTFHGMIRVFQSSKSWPSLIFWCLVVTTCLVFYMLVCGTMIKTYAGQASFIRINETEYHEKSKFVKLCSKHRLKCEDLYFQSDAECQNYDDDCVSLSFSRKISVKLKTDKLFLKIGSEPETFHMTSKLHVHHHFRLKVIHVGKYFMLLHPFIRSKTRLNLQRSPCYSDWKDVVWLKLIGEEPMESYSLHKCQQMRWSLTKPTKLQKEYPCYASCSEVSYKSRYFKTWQSSNYFTLTIEVDAMMTKEDETRKTTIVDVLCFLGGASSLFMGCSCVTLMEIFIFLTKLITTSVLSKDAPELEEDYIEEKYAFEFSDHRNKRRFAVFDRETMEKYNLLKNVEDNRSIVLNRKSSIFSGKHMRKAPLLHNLRQTRNFQKVDIYDGETPIISSKDDSVNTSKKDEFSIDLQDEKRDTLGDVVPVEVRVTRPPLRRGSTTTSHASHASRSSTSTTRTYHISHSVRENRRVFSKNLPMNDF